MQKEGEKGRKRGKIISLIVTYHSLQSVLHVQKGSFDVVALESTHYTELQRLAWHLQKEEIPKQIELNQNKHAQKYL